MQTDTEFRLSELYLACRQLGARHHLTHSVMSYLDGLPSRMGKELILNAPVRYGEGQIIAFRRHPLDLQFACALMGSSDSALRHGFSLCSDEAMGHAGALNVNGRFNHYHMSDRPSATPILEEPDIRRALQALSDPQVSRARLIPDADKPDTVHIHLPDNTLSEGIGKGVSKDIGSIKCAIVSPHGKTEAIKHLGIRIHDASTAMMKIGVDHLMICHHAGLHGLSFRLDTPEFSLRGVFPDLLDTPRPWRVHHTPLRLFHNIFQGLDDTAITLPPFTAQQLRSHIHWLQPPEHPA